MKIEVGATNVRVGSLIFGNRDYPNSAANTPSPSPEKKSKVLTEEAAKKMEHLSVSEHWENATTRSSSYLPLKTPSHVHKPNDRSKVF